MWIMLPYVSEIPNVGFSFTTRRLCNAKKLHHSSLKLAKRFNFIILEDDAYFYLDYRDTRQRQPSYLELEREVNGNVGRVVRFDSLSKLVSAGMRVGVLTGPLEVVQKVIRVTENTRYFILTGDCRSQI
jgi:DNA-binding transcriptional MocR family regulator